MCVCVCVCVCVYPHNGMLFSIKKKGAINLCYCTNDFKHMSNGEAINKRTVHDSVYMTYPEQANLLKNYVCGCKN